MGVTLSHVSALEVLRQLRGKGNNVAEMDRIELRAPSPWKQARWSKRLFDNDVWQWPKPSRERPLEILVPDTRSRLRMQSVKSHVCSLTLPSKPIIWLDEHASMVSPELLFLQMAASFSLPALVMLGYELCGNFSRDWQDPLFGNAALNVPAATSVVQIAHLLEIASGTPGTTRAHEALGYVADHALSVPEAVLGTMCSLPVQESGYGLGPIALNQRIELHANSSTSKVRARYPDLLFPFARVGINYDGEGHLDLTGLVQAAQEATLAEEDEGTAKRKALDKKIAAVREKVVDDLRRTRELAARGYIVLVATKEDLNDVDSLDNLIRQILQCAQHSGLVDTSQVIDSLEDTARKRDRRDLLRSLYPTGGSTHPKRGSF